jgi:hypothetical protein
MERIISLEFPSSKRWELDNVRRISSLSRILVTSIKSQIIWKARGWINQAQGPIANFLSFADNDRFTSRCLIADKVADNHA